VGGVLSLLLGPEFDRLFQEFEYTAFRLETRDRYSAPREAEALRQFVDGEPVDLGWRTTWLRMVREAVRAGRRFERVRVVSVPLTDYSRFAVFCSGQANAAGEDIRYLQRDEAAGLPGHDYWLFDSHKLVRMHFDEDDVMLGGEIVTEPAEIVRANHSRDVAWHRAWLRETFVSR
jgi:hypothetical protein